jgi:hypothetical protein
MRDCSLEIQEELVTSWLGKQLFLQYWYSLGLRLGERVFSLDIQEAVLGIRMFSALPDPDPDP